MEKYIFSLVVFNTITNIIVIVLFGYKQYFSRLKFQWRETLWTKKKYGFDIFLWKFPVNEIPNEGESIFGFDFIHEASEGDYEKYKSAQHCVHADEKPAAVKADTPARNILSRFAGLFSAFRR